MVTAWVAAPAWSVQGDGGADGDGPDTCTRLHRRLTGDSAGDSPECVSNAELRAAVGDGATLALDEADAADLDGHTTYRLVTFSGEPQADRVFASLL